MAGAGERERGYLLSPSSPPPPHRLCEQPMEATAGPYFLNMIQGEGGNDREGPGMGEGGN